MKAFTPFQFSPAHQSADTPQAVFDLRPLDQRTLYLLNMDWDYDRNLPGPDGAFAAFQWSVQGWQGIEPQFTPQAKRDVLKDVGSSKWTLWIAQIAVELKKRSELGEEEAKNS
jgi:hypothetical protein